MKAEIYVYKNKKGFPCGKPFCYSNVYVLLIGTRVYSSPSKATAMELAISAISSLLS